jgi:hypothetical protein
MKCVLMVECETVNPLYLALSKADRKGITPIVKIPAGEVIEHEDAWRLCVIGKANPHDDECRERVLKHMGNPARVALLAKIKAMMAADGVQTLDARTKKWLEHMKTSYAAELGLDVVET